MDVSKPKIALLWRGDREMRASATPENTRLKAIFAALPVTRAIGTPNAIIFKVKAMTPELLRRAKEDPRIDPERVGPGAKWTSFAVHNEQDLRDAMWWLNQAYERAK